MERSVPLTRYLPSREFDIGRRDLEILRREVEALLHHRARRGDERAAVRHDGARADGAAAGQLRAVRIARAATSMLSAGMPNSCATSSGNTVSWPWPEGPGEHVERRIARLAELDRRLLLRRARRRRRARRTPRSRCRAACRFCCDSSLRRGKPAQSEMLKRVVQVARRDRRCRRSSRRRLVREGVLRDEVAPAELDAVDAGLARRLVDQALDQVGDVRPAGAAIGGDRRGVGQREAVAAVERRDAIDVDRVRRRVERVDERPGLREVRAGVADPVEAQAEEAAVAVERELAGELRGAAVMVADDGLEARADPLHRPAERLRRMHQRAVLGIGLRADAEAAADVARVQADTAPTGRPVIAAKFGSIIDMPCELA